LWWSSTILSVNFLIIIVLFFSAVLHLLFLLFFMLNCLLVSFTLFRFKDLDVIKASLSRPFVKSTLRFHKSWSGSCWWLSLGMFNWTCRFICLSTISNFSFVSSIIIISWSLWLSYIIASLLSLCLAFSLTLDSYYVYWDFVWSFILMIPLLKLLLFSNIGIRLNFILKILVQFIWPFMLWDLDSDIVISFSFTTTTEEIWIHFAVKDWLLCCRRSFCWLIFFLLSWSWWCSLSSSSFESGSWYTLVALVNLGWWSLCFWLSSVVIRNVIVNVEFTFYYWVWCGSTFISLGTNYIMWSIC